MAAGAVDTARWRPCSGASTRSHGEVRGARPAPSSPQQAAARAAAGLASYPPASSRRTTSSSRKPSTEACKGCIQPLMQVTTWKRQRQRGQSTARYVESRGRRRQGFLRVQRALAL